MPYAYPNLANLKPQGSGQLSSGDDAIRAIVDALIERIESMVLDINADPLEIRQTAFDALTAVEGKVLLIGPHDGGGIGQFSIGDMAVTGDTGSPVPYRTPIHLPAGAIITNVLAYVNRGITANAVEVRLQSWPVGTAPAVTTHFLMSTTSAGNQELDSGVVNILIEDSKYYYLRINGDDAFQFIGAIITYDTPNLASMR